MIDDRFADQSRFYSESQLIGNLSVSQGTVRRALADLAVRGVLEKRQARCTIVRKKSAVTEFRHLAVFVPDYSSPNVAKFLGHLNAECLNRRMHMQPIYTQRGERLLTAYENLSFAAHEGGVVLLENSPRATKELAAAITDKGYDCVVIDALIQSVTFKSVSISNQSIVHLGLDHLVGLGHRCISLLVNEPEEKESVQERTAAFESWVAGSTVSLVPRIVHSGARLWDDPYAAAQAAMPEVMKGPNRPTAIFAVSDIGAIGAIKWLRENGYRVPEDVSVMGTDGLDLGAMIHPTLTTLARPMEEMTMAVFQLLSERHPAVRNLTFEPALLKRESTAAPQQEL